MKTILHKLRMSRGLHWRGNLPPIPWRDIAVVVSIILAYGAVDHIDRLTDRATAAEQAAEIYSASHTVLENCKKAKIKGFYYEESQQAFSCEIYKL